MGVDQDGADAWPGRQGTTAKDERAAWSLDPKGGEANTTTIVADLRLTGMVAPMVLDGPINREAFEAYVQQFLVPDRIRQILLNLMSNAIKFTDTGIVRLDVRPAADGIIFSVIDQGGAKSPFPAASASDPNSISGSL